MKTNFLFFLLPLILSFHSVDKLSLHEKYPYNLLTDDYGILIEEDLTKEIVTNKLSLADLQNPELRFYRWQCFPTYQVKYHFHTWKDLSPYGGTDIIGLCDFGIRVRLKNESHFYYDRRARPVEFCVEMAKEWKRLTKNQPYLCLNGERDFKEKKETSWTWNKTKTKIGCISLFVGGCENL
ncbi:MAG: hypothetical protein ACLGG0_11255 [Bacteriovoracia bacterium]